MTSGFSMEVTGDLKKEMSVRTGRELGWGGFMGMRGGTGDNEYE